MLLAYNVLSKSIDFLIDDSVVNIVTAVVVELVVFGIGVTSAVFMAVVVVVVVVVVVDCGAVVVMTFTVAVVVGSA